MSAQAAVTVNLECAHYDAVRKQLHGHSYLVEVWFEAGPDLDMIGGAVKQIAAMVDHTQLEESVGDPSMEGIAVWFLRRCGLIANGGMKLTKIVVRRPTLGYVVEAFA